MNTQRTRKYVRSNHLIHSPSDSLPIKDFERWAVAVRQQMLDCLYRRSERSSIDDSSDQ